MYEIYLTILIGPFWGVARLGIHPIDGMKSMGRFPRNSTGSTVVEEWRVVDAIPDSNVVIYGRLEHFKSDQENPGYVCCWGMEYGSQLHGYF